jgi:serine/threonine protein kinase
VFPANPAQIVLLYEAIDVPTSDSLYLVLEFMSGGTIMDIKLGSPAIPLETEVAREYFRQLVLGLEYLHENDVAHRDVRYMVIRRVYPLIKE